MFIQELSESQRAVTPAPALILAHVPVHEFSLGLHRLGRGDEQGTRVQSCSTKDSSKTLMGPVEHAPSVSERVRALLNIRSMHHIYYHYCSL